MTADHSPTTLASFERDSLAQLYPRKETDLELRQDQVAAIADHLGNQSPSVNKPPLIVQGIPEIGSTRLVTVAASNLGSPCLYLDVENEGSAVKRGSTGMFEQRFGLTDVAILIARIDDKKRGLHSDWGVVDQVSQQILQSGKSPLEYLSEFMANRGQKSGVIIDGAIMYVGQAEKMQEMARQLALANLNPVLVSPRLQRHSNQFRQFFPESPIISPRALSSSEVAFLLNSPLTDREVKWSDEAAQVVWGLSGGRHNEVRNIAREMLAYYFGLEVHKGFIPGEVVEGFAADMNQYGMRSIFPDLLPVYQNLMHEAITEDEGRALMKVAKGDVSDIDPASIQTLQDLTLVGQDENQAPQINGGIFTAFLHQIYPLFFR